MKQETREWQCTMEVPARDGWNWSFEFACTFKRIDPLHFVVDWHDTTMGSGSFSIKDCSTVWLQNFKAYSLLHSMVLPLCFEWNVLGDGEVSRV
jgi:hypothetical protein